MMLRLGLNYTFDSNDSVRAVNTYLPIRGSQIFHETSGEGEPLLLLHGGFGTVEDFASQTPELAKHFKVVAFERPGHGHTADNGGPFSFVTMSECTIEFIEALGLSATNLVGWSDGAIIALVVSISRPDLVKRMICVSGSFNTSYMDARFLEWLRSATPESFRKNQARLVQRYNEATP